MLNFANRYPTYELVTSHLLPLLHEEHDDISSESKASAAMQGTKSISNASAQDRWHALLTSHHLVSPTKRCNMSQWASSLHLNGFAKLGYPGVIYIEGSREAVEEFVGDVRAMQWKALKLRFMECLPQSTSKQHDPDSEKQSSVGDIKSVMSWKEFEKVGEVVQEMRLRGREAYVVEMGVGSVGTK